MTNELATPKRHKRPRLTQLKRLALILLLGILVAQSGVANAQDDTDLDSEDTSAGTGTGGNSNATYSNGVDQGDGPPPLASANPNTIPPGPTRIRIDGIEPEAGPNYGETRVLVRGGPFGVYQALYPKPMCKFGHDDMVVEATYVLCTDRPHSIDQKEAHHKDKNDICLQCDNSPASNKAEIVPFTVSLTGDFSDVQNSVPYRYYQPSRIFAIYPRYGPKDGETVVQVWGENFLNFDENTRCAFGSKSVPATFINSNYMICVSPFSDVVQKPIPFTVSLNNQQNSRDSLFFWYYSWPAISELVPDRGPDAGGTAVLLRGRNYFPFKDEGGTIDNRNDTFCMFENLAKVPATIINSTKVICHSPPSFVLRQSIVEITLNNQQYTDDNNIFYYYRPPYLFDINPREGPVRGGTRVIAIGSNFRDTGNVTCKFNETIVPGKFLTQSEIECFSPPVEKPGYVPLSVSLELDMYSQPVQYLYYETPLIYYIQPQCGPDYGFTQITVFGKNFIDMGHNKAMCVFNKTIFTNATIMENNIMKCDSPTLLNNQGFSMMTNEMIWYWLEVTIDGGREIAGPVQKFMYYKDPKIVELLPDSGPTRGGTKVRVTGNGFTQEGACNRTTRFAVIEVKPINITNDTQMWVSSPKVSIPDSTVFSIALNGQQFARDITLHIKDLQNSFEFYEDPFVSQYGPKSGPSIGGTKIRLDGYGFTPKKDRDGNIDKNRNKVWIRFVDPDSGEELAPATQVNPEDLSDDELFWSTPALPAETKAVLQLSLNDQDWTPVQQVGKPYSFVYYESPHITKLHPSFGPVKAKKEQFMDIEGTNFKCPDVNCTGLRVRFGEPSNATNPYNSAIFYKAQWLNETFVRVKIPKYTKPDVLRVELTLNKQDYTNDQKTYGYYDPYVLNAEPRLISVEGTTKVRIKGFGFVNSNETKAQYGTPQSGSLACSGGSCIKDATFIDKNTLLTDTFPQNVVNYKDTNDNVMWDAITIEASVYGNDFTENNVELYYYEEPDYQGLSQDEAPANHEVPLFIKTDFKSNNMDRLQKYGNFTCRYKAEDGRVMYTKAEMVKYPIEKGTNGKPNNIRCKTPLWDLKGQTLEKVKLDIAVNGQDFKGNFDFTFTVELKIHRTVPMSGPVQGNSKTRIIGLGYKPPKENAELKWGVLETQTIEKASVVEYIYYRIQFENMIEGSEELKAYIYEAAQFARVDLPMIETNTYHAFYMNTLRLRNWTLTHGGPYYAEVGKNIKIEYITTERIVVTGGFDGNANVTTVSTSKNVTFNATRTNSSNSSAANNSDQQGANAEADQDNSQQDTDDSSVAKPQAVNATIKYREQMVNKTWTYYDYEPSNVEYYYYKDCIIKDMQPHLGVLQGGTRVQVVGAWFKYMPEYGVVPHCKFGDKIVRAIFDSTVRIVCSAPPSTELGVEYPFEVSLNGVDWSKSGFKFTYYEQPVLTDITPDSGPESGGTPIYILGANFTNMSDASQFNCRFTPINLNVPPKHMPATFINSTTIMCPSPGGWGKGDAMRLQVTINGGDYDNNNFTFTFFSVTRTYPRSGPSDGSGGDIIIEGYGFRNDSNPVCKLNNTVYTPNSVTWNQIRCPMPRAAGGEQFFGNVPFAVAPNGRDWNNFLGGFQYYPQPIVEDIFPKQGPAIGIGVINFYGDGFRDDYNLIDLGCKVGDSVGKAFFVTSKHLKCIVQDMELVNEGEYLPAQVALNSYSWTTLTNSTYFLPYGIDQIYPNGGPTTGVTDVMVSGKGFVDEEGNTARCRFGTPANYAIVDAQIISYEKLVCKAPSEFKLVPPAAFPEDVPFSIAFTSDEYDPYTETSHKFRFYDQPVLIRSEPSEVEVGTIREILVYADENSEFFDPLPASKPMSDAESESGAPTSIGGQGGIMCKFGRFGETQAIFINTTVIKCVTPAVEDDPDSIYREAVKLTIAMNGQDHEDETSQVDFTFVGTGTYLVFWPFIIGALLIGLLIVALVVCCAAIFQKMSMDDFLLSKRNAGMEGQPHVFNIGGGLMVPRGRADWHAERSSVDMIEKASGQNFA